MEDYNNRIKVVNEPTGQECFLCTVMVTDGPPVGGIETMSTLSSSTTGMLSEGVYIPQTESYGFYETNKDLWTIDPVETTFSLTDVEWWPQDIESADEEIGLDTLYDELDYYLEDIRDIDIGSYYWCQMRIHSIFDYVDIANLHITMEIHFTELWETVYNESGIGDFDVHLSHIDINDHPAVESMYADMGSVHQPLRGFANEIKRN